MRRDLIVGAFCLAAGLSYRANGFLPPGMLQTGYLFSLSALLLTSAILAKRSQDLERYWEIPFAFFIFSIAGAIDITFTGAFLANVLHQTTSSRDPLASTIQGTVLVQLVSTLSIVIPIILLTKASGSNLSSIYIDRQRIRKGLLAGAVGFLVFYFLTAFGIFQTLFPNNGVTPPRLLTLTPPLLILVLSNGLREELWFRGIFFKNYEKSMGSKLSNVIQAIIFTSFHFQVQYTSSLLPFLGLTFILGLWLGYLMQQSGSILGPSIFHAGADIPILLAFISYASP